MGLLRAAVPLGRGGRGGGGERRRAVGQLGNGLELLLGVGVPTLRGPLLLLEALRRALLRRGEALLRRLLLGVETLLRRLLLGAEALLRRLVM